MNCKSSKFKNSFTVTLDCALQEQPNVMTLLNHHLLNISELLIVNPQPCHPITDKKRPPLRAGTSLSTRIRKVQVPRKVPPFVKERKGYRDQTSIPDLKVIDLTC